MASANIEMFNTDTVKKTPMDENPMASAPGGGWLLPGITPTI